MVKKTENSASGKGGRTRWSVEPTSGRQRRREKRDRNGGHAKWDYKSSTGEEEKEELCICNDFFAHIVYVEVREFSAYFPSKKTDCFGKIYTSDGFLNFNFHIRGLTREFGFFFFPLKKPTPTIFNR